MLVTKKAPDFTAAAVLGSNQIVNDFNLYKNIGEKGAVVFFYPNYEIGRASCRERV